MKSVILLIVSCLLLTGAGTEPDPGAGLKFSSYTEIPGLDDAEKEAVEALKAKFSSFVFAVPRGSNAFVDETGEFRGSMSLLCGYLTDLFGIPFELRLMEWPDVLDGLDDGTVHFTGALTPTDERVETYSFTDPIAEYVIYTVRRTGSPQLDQLGRPPRLGVTGRSYYEADVFAHTYGNRGTADYVPVRITGDADALEKLRSGEIDAFYYEGMEPTFIEGNGGEFTAETPSETVYEPVSFAAKKGEMTPIINVFQKALAAGATQALTVFYTRGMADYKRWKFNTLLTPEEKEYLGSMKGTPIKVLAGFDNYPIIFYDEPTGGIQGIAWDVLTEIGRLSGLEFEPANQEPVHINKVLNLLEQGTYPMTTELANTRKREDHFLLSDEPYTIDHYAFISKPDYPQVNLNTALFAQVGVREGTAFEDFYTDIFRDEQNHTSYPDNETLFDALDNGDVDLVLATENKILGLTNYQERTDYRVNMVFDRRYESVFGFNRNETILCSIVSKAQRLVDTAGITSTWTKKTYDYRREMARRQLFWAIAVAVLLALLFVSGMGMLAHSRKTGKVMEKLVRARTAEIEAANMRVRVMYDNMPISSTLCARSAGTENYFIIDLNQAIVDTFGTASADEFRARFQEMLPEFQEDGARSADRLNSAMNRAFGGEYQVFEFTTRKLSGELIPMEVTLVPLNYSGEPMVASFLRDLRAEKAAQERLRVIYASMPLSLALWNREGRIVELNEETLRLFGIGSEEEYKTHFFDLSPEFQSDGSRSIDTTMDYIQAAFETGSQHLEWLHRRADGTLFPAEINLVRLVFSDGDVLVAAYTHDLSAVKAAEAYAQMMMDSAPLAASIWNDNGKMLDCNLESLNIFGLKKKSEYIDHFYDLNPEYQPDGEHTKEKADQMIRETLKDGYRRFEWMYLNSSGEPLPVETTLVRIPWGKSYRILAYSQDLRRIKLLLAEIQDQMTEVEAAAKAKSDFLARMSHEIRTPMNAILGISSLVLHNDLPPKVYEDIMSIQHESNNLLRIINDILDFSKIESGKMEIIAAEYGLASLINDVIGLIRIRTAEKTLLLAVTVDPTIPHRLIGDMIRIRQILLNILGNAVKYTEHGYVSFTVSMAENVTAKTGDEITLRFTVSDTGAGIKEKDLNNLFKEFTRLDVHKHSSVVGTGLGLVIAESLARQMKGHIDVESRYGKGSTFTVYLKQKVADAEPLARVEHPEEKDSLIYGFRQLYADVAVTAMQKLGVKLDLAMSSQEFAGALKKKQYAFVFVASAWQSEALEMMKRAGSGAKPVVMTDFGDIAPANVLNIPVPIHTISLANALNGRRGTTYEQKVEIELSFTAPGFMVLIVDDIATNLKVARRFVEMYGVDVDTALSGANAVKMAGRKRYDMIFMDHMMPEMDGIEAAARIRALDGYAKTPIIALTANAVTGMREYFINSGFDDYIAKPIEQAKLNELMERWVPEERRAAPGNESPAYEPAAEIDLELLRGAGVDVDAGIGIMGGSAALYRDLMLQLCADIEERLPAIQTVPGADTMKDFTTVIHAIKSGCASAGAAALSARAAALEQAGKAGDGAAISADIEAFTKDLAAFTALIRTSLGI